MRLSLFVLCVLLFAAAAGRYHAEAGLRAVEREIASLEARREASAREIQMLRAEIASLENPDRLADLAAAHTELRPLSSAQFLTADDFMIAFGRNETLEGAESGGRETPIRDAAPTALAAAGPSALN